MSYAALSVKVDIVDTDSVIGILKILLNIVEAHEYKAVDQSDAITNGGK